jgi:Bacterial SH3 domain
MLYAALILSSVILCGGASPSVAQVPEIVRITAIELNVRQGPGTAFDVITKVREGGLLGVLERRDGWVKVFVLGGGSTQIGWVNAAHVAPEDRPAPATPSPAPAPLPVVPLPFARLPEPLEVEADQFECDEDIFDGGFDSCEIDVRVTIDLPSAYAPYYASDVDIDCNAEVEYRRQDGLLTQSERNWESISVSLSGGSGSEAFTMEFDFGFGIEPVREARVSSLECHPS